MQSAEEIELLLLHAERNAPSPVPDDRDRAVYRNAQERAVRTALVRREHYGVDPADCVLLWSTPKSGKPRFVPIHPLLLPILPKRRKECPLTPQPCECARRCSSHQGSEGKETAGRVIRKRKLGPL